MKRDAVEEISYRGHTINIYYDDGGENPRTDWDNADVMFFQHRRYTLGDKDAEDPFEDVSIFELESNQDDNLNSEQYRIDGDKLQAAEEMLGEWHDRILHEKESEAQQLDAERTFEAYDYLTHLCEADTERRLRSDVAICLPVMMYDHSGITIWHGSSNPAQDSAGWDSGLIGFHYVTKSAVEKEWNGDMEAAERYMEATLKTYDSYLRGDVYGYVIDEDGDSCWGFIGDYDDEEESSLMEFAKNAIDCEVEAAAREEAMEKDTLALECD